MELTKESWEDFYRYKLSLALPKRFTDELRAFIDSEAYLPVVERINRGERFPLPKRAVISKQDTGKKRVIYTYPPAENIVLKLLTYELLRRYDGIFADGLYSFRPGRTAQQAFRRLSRTPGIEKMYCYKVDISNYFNSVDVSRLLPMLEETLSDDRELFEFLRSLLCEPEVLERGRVFRESKGIMAGTPLSAFYANLYLKDLDFSFEGRGIPYARYSDDIILFAHTKEQAEDLAAEVRDRLWEKGLEVNPDKESLTPPGEQWVFLGLCRRGGVIDIAPASVAKLKAKMRRKARSLLRWRQRGGHSPEDAAKAFIRIFERKLFEGAGDSDLTWSYWYFPVITTAESLRTIDLYAQDCLRYILTGARNKSRFRVRYSRLKTLGYRSLVHEYYARRKAAES